MNAEGNSADDPPQAPADPPRDGELRGIIDAVWKLAHEEARRCLHAPLRAKETPSELAQSVVAEILLREGQLEYRGEAALRGLVKAILVAKLTARVRKHLAKRRDVRRETTTASSLGDVTPAAPGASPASIVVWREMIDRAEAEIAKLPEREQRILRLGTAGKTAKEIAAAEGLSEANAQKILWRARRTIDAKLFGREPPPEA
jgi:RNA polymerase sigma factor (sigma-70 family)